jgi:hypothetical protein
MAENSGDQLRDARSAKETGRGPNRQHTADLEHSADVVRQPSQYARQLAASTKQNSSAVSIE